MRMEKIGNKNGIWSTAAPKGGEGLKTGTGRYKDLSGGRRTALEAEKPEAVKDGVRLDISEEARRREAEDACEREAGKNRRKERKEKERKEIERREELQMAQFQEMAIQQQERVQEAGKTARTQAKCMKIAMRLAAGDKVPYQDERFLMENDPELHSKAMSVRIPKQDPEEYDSVLEEEDMESPIGLPEAEETAGRETLPRITLS